MATDAPVKFSPQLTQQFTRDLGSYANVVDQNLLRLKKAIDDANATFVDQRATINRLIQTLNISVAAAKQVPQMPGFDTGEDAGDGGTIVLGVPGARGRDGIGLPGQDGDDGEIGQPGPPGRAGRDGVAVFMPATEEDLVEQVFPGAPSIIWPPAGRVLVSSGTATPPTSDAAFTFDTAAHELAIGVGGTQSWYNSGSGSGSYERVRAIWVANVFALLSESAGGVVRSITIDAATATATLNGANAVVSSGSVSLQVSSVSAAFALPTIRASAAGATLDALSIAGSTVQVTGATNITTAAGFNYFTINQPTYSGLGTAKTVTAAATVSILGAPLAASSLTITNAYALWVQSGQAQFDGNVNLCGAASRLGFFGLSNAAVQTIVGSRTGSPAPALTNLLAALNNYGIIINNSTP